MSGELFSTEFSFSLPGGLVDPEGRVHRTGTLRLTTARDEILVKKDPRVRENPAYESIVMLARVITRLGSLDSVTPDLLEGLFTRDLAYLREFYNRVNQQGEALVAAQCPQCNCNFALELVLAGEF